MEEGVCRLLAEISLREELPKFNLNFWHTPSYSPRLNPAEYLIHEVRRNGLYNVPCSLSVHEKAKRIQSQLARGSPMTDIQMQKLIDFITHTKVARF